MSWHNSIQIDGFAMKSGRNRGSLIEIKKVFFLLRIREIGTVNKVLFLEFTWKKCCLLILYQLKRNKTLFKIVNSMFVLTTYLQT